MTLLALTVNGCVHYAAIEQVHTGMTIQELMQVDTPCYYRGTKEQEVCYSCQFKVPNDHSVKPYILTFKDGKLVEITLDERELDRQQMRNWYYYGPGYYYYYGYPYGPYPYRYGYPYRYP